MFNKLSAKSGGVFSARLIRLMAVISVNTLLLALALLVPKKYMRLQLDMLWNVILSIIPLVFALLLYRRRAFGKHGAAGIVFTVLWLVFFPNAPYMITDLIHLDYYVFYADGRFVPSISAWLGLLHISLAVVTGCLCGFLSLYLVHCAAQARFGKKGGWLVCAGASLLSGAGIYIGRFLRFNTWDLLHRPFIMLATLIQPPVWHMLALFLLFAALTFGGYLVFYACWQTPQDFERLLAVPQNETEKTH